MQFALVDNQKVKPGFGSKGLCPGCQQTVVARCGTQRVHHWAHARNRFCDSWWEPETEWHRAWKNKFPADWQEVFLPDERTGEKHIADLRTADGLVVEFQHSHITPEERASREAFYKDMVWVIDGTRLQKDYPRFEGNIQRFQTRHTGVFQAVSPKDCFPTAWANSAVPVVFDFLGMDTVRYAGDVRSSLYCLLPERMGAQAVFTKIGRHDFIRAILDGNWRTWANGFVANLKQAELKRLGLLPPQQQASRPLNHFHWQPGYGKGRIF